MTATVHDISAPTKRELAERLAHLCAEAAKMTRRGYIGTRTDEYARRHAQIDETLTEPACALA